MILLIAGASHTGKTALAQRLMERLDDSGCTMEALLRDNGSALEQCRLHRADYILIDDAYRVDIEL